MMLSFVVQSLLKVFTSITDSAKVVICDSMFNVPSEGFFVLVFCTEKLSMVSV